MSGGLNEKHPVATLSLGNHFRTCI